MCFEYASLAAGYRLAASGFYCQDTSKRGDYKNLGHGKTVQQCAAATKDDKECTGEGFHYYAQKSGKSGDCWCAKGDDITPSGDCVSGAKNTVDGDAKNCEIYLFVTPGTCAKLSPNPNPNPHPHPHPHPNSFTVQSDPLRALRVAQKRLDTRIHPPTRTHAHRLSDYQAQSYNQGYIRLRLKYVGVFDLD